MTTKMPSYEVLTKIGGRVIVSMDSRIYEDFIEDQEMNAAKPFLRKRYQESLDSGLGMSI